MNLRSVSRGDVYLADLPAAGAPLRKIRPVVVVQNDAGNRRSPETIVLSIRRACFGKRLPIRVFATAGTGGLRKDSDIDAGQVYTIHKSNLGPRLGRMPPEVMAAVDAALKKSLALR